MNAQPATRRRGVVLEVFQAVEVRLVHGIKHVIELYEKLQNFPLFGACHYAGAHA
jgi:hypothetical protein